MESDEVDPPNLKLLFNIYVPSLHDLFHKKQKFTRTPHISATGQKSGFSLLYGEPYCSLYNNRSMVNSTNEDIL